MEFIYQATEAEKALVGLLSFCKDISLLPEGEGSARNYPFASLTARISHSFILEERSLEKRMEV